MTKTPQTTPVTITDLAAAMIDSNERTVCLFVGDVTSDIDIVRNTVQLPIAIARKSNYLSARIKQFTTQGDTNSIALSNIDPAALKLYAWWLKSGDAPLFLHDESGPVAQPQHSLTWRECFDLIQAHMLGCKFSDVEFQRYILTQLRRWLIPQQPPDLELLDFLWESDTEAVSGELLCFVIEHMFRMNQNLAALLVDWLRRLVGSKRMMDYIENIADAKRCGVTSSKMNTAAVETSSSGKSNLATEESMSISTDPTAPEAKEISVHRSIVPGVERKKKGEILRETELPELVTSNSKEMNIDKPQLGGGNVVQHTKSGSATRRGPTSTRIRQELQDFPEPLRIHPKASKSIAIHSEIQRLQTPNPNFPPLPRLKSSVRQNPVHIKRVPTSKSLRAQIYDHPEPRGGAQDSLAFKSPVAMPAIANESLQRLDFWTDPGDAPGPDFFNIPVEVSRLQNGHDRDKISPTAKQIVQSFRLTRTPTPRRRSTRSWSVASIRSLGSEKPVHTKSVMNKPGRSLISRKPVSKAGMDFLGTYADGKMIQRMVSLNSRPERLAPTGSGGKIRDGEELWDWEIPVRRPGTA